MKCALCNTALTRTGTFWVCPEHGVVEPGTAPTADAGRGEPSAINYSREGTHHFQEHLIKQLNCHDQKWSVSLCKMGDMFRVVRDDQRARQCYEESLDLAQRLAEQLPNDAEYAEILSNTSDRMGDLYQSWYSPGRAIEFYSKSIEIRQRLAQQFPASADYAHDLSVSLRKMGDMCRALGDGVRARYFHERSLDLCQLLVERDSGNAEYARNLVVAYRTMARSVRFAHPVDCRWWWRRIYDNVHELLDACEYLYRAYKVLSGIKERRWYISTDDDRALKRARPYIALVDSLKRVLK